MSVPAVGFSDVAEQFAAQMEDVLWLTTGDGAEVVWMSPAASRLCGIAAEDIAADPARGLDLVHPDDRDQLVEALRSSYRSGGLQQFRIRLTDGTVRWIRQRTFPVLVRNGVRWTAGIAEDITVQRHAGDRLHRTLHDLATLMPSLERSLETIRAQPSAASPDDVEAPRVATLLGTLTRRERQVHDLTVRGDSTKEIAALLWCSPKTVAVHRGRLLRKLGVRSVAELVRLNLAGTT